MTHEDPQVTSHETRSMNASKIHTATPLSRFSNEETRFCQRHFFEMAQQPSPLSSFSLLCFLLSQVHSLAAGAALIGRCSPRSLMASRVTDGRP